jgi:SAM-dependent methyltransferase
MDVSQKKVFSGADLKLNLGSGRKVYSGFINVDMADLPETNIKWDLENIPLPFETNSVSEVICEHVLEHLGNFNEFLVDLYRVTKPGGCWRFVVPYYKYEGTFRDPTHKCFFSENTFDYFSDGHTFDYYSPVRLKVLKKILRNSSKTNVMTPIKKIRKYIPFKRVLNIFLWNIYSEIYLEIRVIKPAAGVEDRSVRKTALESKSIENNQSVENNPSERCPGYWRGKRR